METRDGGTLLKVDGRIKKGALTFQEKKGASSVRLHYIFPSRAIFNEKVEGRIAPSAHWFPAPNALIDKDK